MPWLVKQKQTKSELIKHWIMRCQASIQHGKLPSSRSMSKERNFDVANEICFAAWDAHDQGHHTRPVSVPVPQKWQYFSLWYFKIPNLLVVLCRKEQSIHHSQHGRVGAFSPGSGFRFRSFRIPDPVSSRQSLGRGNKETGKDKKGLVARFLHSPATIEWQNFTQVSSNLSSLLQNKLEGFGEGILETQLRKAEIG